jgi:hypothetical protein
MIIPLVHTTSFISLPWCLLFPLISPNKIDNVQSRHSSTPSIPFHIRKPHVHVTRPIDSPHHHLAFPRQVHGLHKNTGYLDDQVPDPVQQYHGGDEYSRELEDGDFIPGLRHAAEAGCGAL